MSEFVPMTRDEITLMKTFGSRDDCADLYADTMLAYLDRAEKAEQLANRWYEAAHQFEQELARERERAEKWKEVAQMFEDAHGTGLKSIYGAARDSFAQLLASERTPQEGEVNG